MEKENIVYFAKTRDVKSPARGNSKASGIDMYVPTFDEKFLDDLYKKNADISKVKPGCYEFVVVTNKEVVNTENSGKEVGFSRILLAPHARICIPSGIIWKGKDGLSMNMHNKSGIGTKKGLAYLAEVVDVDYIGETHISLVNTSNYIVEILEGEKIIQILQEPCALDTPVETSVEEVTSIETERGANWQGSTGVK